MSRLEYREIEKSKFKNYKFKIVRCFAPMPKEKKTAEQIEKEKRIREKIKSAREELNQNFQTERQEQPIFLKWFRKQFPGVLIISIPNGAVAGKREKSRLKTQGLLSGTPDLYVPAWKLWIEMKQDDGGSVSKAQEKIIDYLRSIGDTVSISNGSEQAKQACLDMAAKIERRQKGYAD